MYPRSFNGCWTCRLRRKKCNERRPSCDACKLLGITCYYDKTKPDWFDGGEQQAEMAAQIKRDIKAYRRSSAGQAARAKARRGSDASSADSPSSKPDPYSWSGQVSKNGILSGPYSGITTGWPESLLVTFYLENLLPFLYPHWKPSPKNGGRSWILDMLMSSPVFKQAAFCQTTFFYSLALGTEACSLAWDRVFDQTQQAYASLRESLRLFNEEGGLEDHLSDAVRVLAGIMQLLCYDSTISSLESTAGHLQGAATLLQQILSIPSSKEIPQYSFDTVLERLDWSPWILPSGCVQVPSADQEVFRFSTALVIFVDIIASTALQMQPKLYIHHRLLLGRGATRPRIELDKVFGCENWVMLQIGEIASLDAWKKECKNAGNLDYMKLVRRAMVIKDALDAQLTTMSDEPRTNGHDEAPTLDMFALSHSQPSASHLTSSHVATRIWAYAALAYLSVVVSGFQPASEDTRYAVDSAIRLLTQEVSPPAMIRTMQWPLTISGCLADPMQQASIRNLIRGLEPQRIFGGLIRALIIMEGIWADRSAEHDITDCFRYQGDLVLLV
jgi:C6 transcription factor Pro1